MPRRVLLVGWDSADWKIIQPLVDAGKMPVLQRLVEGGVSGRLASLEPMISPLLWTSVATGKRAHSHGIFSFTSTDLHTGRVESVGSHHRGCHAIWNILHREGRRSLICNWFASHPAEPLRGLTVSNEFAVHRAMGSRHDFVPRSSVSPQEHWEKLEALRVVPEDIDESVIKLLVPRAAEIDQEHDRRLARLAVLLAENFNVHSAFTYGMEAVEWDFAAVYYEALDLTAHEFMPYTAKLAAGLLSQEVEIYSGVLEGMYRLHDAMLGRLINLAGPDATTIILSDHGFHSQGNQVSGPPDNALALARWHRRHGVLVMHGPGIRRDELIHGAGLLDVTPTILALFGLPFGEDMHGRVLREAFEETVELSSIPSWDEMNGDFGRVTSHSGENVSGHLLQRFVDLGYLAPASCHEPLHAASSWQTEQYFRALALVDGQYFEEALLILDELHEAEPERDDIACALATVLLRLGLLDEAEEVVSLLEIAACSPAALQLRADLERRRGNRAIALAALTAVEDAAGTSVVTLNMAGALYIQLRQMDRAEAVFRRSLELDKENPSALSGLSFCRSSQGRYREAADLALEGISMLFPHFYSHYCYGIALLHLGDREGALRAFENTLRLQPRFHQVRHYLIYLLRGNSAAKSLIELHRAALSQRAMDRIKSDYHRIKLSRRILAARSERASERIGKRSKAVEGQENQGNAPVLEFLIISGLPRSGTSLVMQMLAAAGQPIMTDGVRAADEDNLQGYYEWEGIKELPTRPAVLTHAAGHVIKVVSPLLPSLPRRHRYRIVFLRRDLEETVRSQDRMRARLTGVPPDDLKETVDRLSAHLESIRNMLAGAPNVEWIEIEFKQLLQHSPNEIDRLREFCRIPRSCTSRMLSVIKDVPRKCDHSVP